MRGTLPLPHPYRAGLATPWELPHLPVSVGGSLGRGAQTRVYPLGPTSWSTKALTLDPLGLSQHRRDTRTGEKEEVGRGRGI